MIPVRDVVPLDKPKDVLQCLPQVVEQLVTDCKKHPEVHKDLFGWVEDSSVAPVDPEG